MPCAPEQTHFPFHTFGVGAGNEGISCNCARRGFLARLATDAVPADANAYPPVLEALPYFEFFLDHAFDGRHVQVLPAETLQGASAVVGLTGSPDNGLQALDEIGLLSLPWQHMRRDPWHN